MPAFSPNYWEVFSTFATAAERFSTHYPDDFNWYEIRPGKSLYTTIRNVKKAFSLVTENGEEYQICTDLDEKTHSECITEGAKWD